MTTAKSNLEIILEAKAAQAEKELEDFKSKALGGLGKAFTDVGKIATGFLAANVLSGAAEKVTGFFSDSVAAIKESMAVQSQLDTVLKSTGGAAGVTAKQVNDMAGQMEKLSLFEDEAIISSSSLLLTFTNIGKDVFPRAQQTVLDMSQALGQDLKSSSVQLGKALNDPIKGITALSRVGVSFTEDQKKMIAAMVEGGDVAGAQAVILAELEKEFGGSAKAASDAAGKTEQYKDRMNDLKEQIGAGLLPIQEKWMELQAAVINLIASKVIPIIGDFIKYITVTWQEGDKLNDFLANLPAPLQGVALQMGALALFIKQDLIPALQGIASMITDTLIPAFASGAMAILNHKETAAIAIGALGVAIVIALGPASLAVAALIGIPVLVEKLAPGFGDEALLLAIAAVGVAIFVALGPLSQAALALAGIVTAVGLVKDNWLDLKRTIESTPISGRVTVAGQDFSGGQGGLLDRLLDKVLPFRAAGGPVMAGNPYIVGERRPELFVPSQNGYILPSVPAPGPTQVHVHLEGSTLYGFDDFERKVNAAVANGKRRGMGYGFA